MDSVEIERSKKSSQEKYRKMKKEMEEYSNELKKCRKFFRDNLEYYSIPFGPLAIDIGYRIQDETIEYALSICSENDQYSSRVARANIGKAFLSNSTFFAPMKIKNKEFLGLFFILEIISMIDNCSSEEFPAKQKIKKILKTEYIVLPNCYKGKSEY